MGTGTDSEVDRAWVEDLIERNRYLVLATTDGDEPWIAPVEYLADEDLNLYFFSTADSRHVRHLKANPTVAVAVFDHEGQPDYTGDVTAQLNGVQMKCTVELLPEEEYTEDIRAGIEALQPPIPPYEAFRITPLEVHAPRIVDGVNVRDRVDMT